MIGVLPGEGIGPEVVAASLEVLEAVRKVRPCDVRVEYGGRIGHEAEQQCGRALSHEVSAFCGDVFARGGAILAGAGGGRFVYEMRIQFDLFCKLSPLIVHDELQNAGRMKSEHCRDIDVMVVRENTSGVYQGQWSEETTPQGERRAAHRFSYDESVVRRIVQVGARIATARRGEIAVIHKLSGVPTVSQLWIDVATEVARAHGVRLRLFEVDYAAYALIQHPELFDVIVTPNLFGDIISDLGGILLGSRGLCYSGNFSPNGSAVYQTNHGAALDLAGRDVANPAGQILSLAMLLRESFGMIEAANLMERAVGAAWARGWYTFDIAPLGSRSISTREMGRRIAEIVGELAGAGS